MSYILDALRRAQAERERGQVPGLHAQPGLGGVHRTRATGAPAAQRPPWLWALLGAALVALLMALAGLLQRGGEGASAPGPVAASSAVKQPTAPAGLPAAADAAAPPLVVVSAAPAPRGLAAADGPATATRPAAAGAALPPVAQAPLSPVSPAALPVKAVVPATQAAPAPAPATVPPPVTEPAAPPAVPTLTADQRREWPPLALGGSVWSETPAARFVILGGQVVREGESTPDGVLVERITPKAVVLRWRDQRGSLPF